MKVDLLSKVVPIEMPLSSEDKLSHLKFLVNNYSKENMKVDLSRHLHKIIFDFIYTFKALLEGEDKIPEGYWLCDIKSKEANTAIDKAVQTMLLLSCLERHQRTLYERLQLEKATVKQLVWELEDISLDSNEFEVSIESRIAHLPITNIPANIQIASGLLKVIKLLISSTGEKALEDFKLGALPDNFFSKVPLDTISTVDWKNIKLFLNDLSNEFQSDNNGFYVELINNLLNNRVEPRVILDDEDMPSAIRYIANAKLRVDDYHSN